MSRKIRVLIGKPGLDGHDRGGKVVAYALRDAGFEVLYSGLRQTPDQIVNAAIQEGVDVVGLSILSGAHVSLTRRVVQGLRDKGGQDVIVLVGGLIPAQDVPSLKGMGVTEVFTSGASIDHIVGVIRDSVAARAETQGT